MQRIHHSTIVSRVSFENVSYKYSSYIPRLSSATAVLNTALIFLLPLDPPPGNSKAATAASACTDCIRSLTGGDDARPSRWNTLMEDISMLELRLRQCQRMIDNWGKRFGKPLVSLVVLTAEHADSGRKPPTRRQEERLAVESLWRKWGPSGVGILGDRFDYEWNGDKLHSLVSDLSEILAQHWRTNSITAL
ncbi:hypothetical protein FOZ61_002065 [Perkinsus olseni]|uniref:Uncharacterized protein n=1 Tax=Perkinsus olseni TaxID=32597 RepID=A0A7J6LUF5_PEROL|nr:hypothetical protein FOL46_007534 [Perkinsus olseni]KAF4662929.1 hypothetical protein FOZ61_002065 [Perkinsus olseni]